MAQSDALAPKRRSRRWTSGTPTAHWVPCTSLAGISRICRIPNLLERLHGPRKCFYCRTTHNVRAGGFWKGYGLWSSARGEPDGSPRYTVFQPGDKAPIAAPTGAIKIVPNPTAVLTSPGLSLDRDPATYPTPAPAAAPIPKPINADRARLFTSARTTSKRTIFRSVPRTSSVSVSLDTPTKRPVQVRWSEHSTRNVWPDRSCSTFDQLASSRCAPKALRATWATSKSIHVRAMNTSARISFFTSWAPSILHPAASVEAVFIIQPLPSAFGSPGGGQFCLL